MPAQPDALLATVLQVYRPARAALHRPDAGELTATGQGGGLVSSVEDHGIAPLAAALQVGERLVLEDGDASLDLLREDGEARMTVEWSGGPRYEERIPVAGTGLARLAALQPAPAGAVQPSTSTPSTPSTARMPRVDDVLAALHDPAQPLVVTEEGLHRDSGGPLPQQSIGRIPAIDAGSLGAPAFREAHGVRGNLVSGAMAGGIGSVDILIAMHNAGLMGFFGAGGLDLDAVKQALERVGRELPDDGAFGFNLLHNPVEPEVEERTVDLYIEHGIRRVSASAYMTLTPAVVRYRLHDIHEADGRIRCPNRVLAKISRPEVAEPFMRPPPKRIIEKLVDDGHLTKKQARLAARVPVAEDITAEADSGGHTDRRPLVGLVPTILRLRDRVMQEETYAARGVGLRVGAAGGLGSPAAVHAAFTMGADYVLTGSINQSSVEAGTSKLAKMMIATAGIADCTTGPAPDMFELGAHVQVLGQGTMYAQRAGRLYDLYRRYDRLQDIPDKDRSKIERTIFRKSLEEVWEDTRRYWQQRDPDQLSRARDDPHHKMALVFRWYLGMTSRWARTGDPDRRRDYQLWCGPAMGLFNDWVRGSWLDPLENRKIADISWALLHGAAALRRVETARALGLSLPAGATNPPPWRRAST